MVRWALLALSFATVGCGQEETVPSPPVEQGRHYEGSLAVDIRGSASVSLDVGGDGVVKAAVSLDEAAADGVLDWSKPLSFVGQVEGFPENGSELYTGKASLGAFGQGVCGGEALSLGLALHRRGGNDRVGGSLSVYCGEGRFFGVPGRIFRLSGDLVSR